jgi:hypothetical protein
MKTTTLKKAIHTTLFCAMLVSAVIISKNKIAQFKHVCQTQKANYTITNCIWEMIY